MTGYMSMAKNVFEPHRLKPLSMYEQNLVSLYRGQRHIFIMKASGGIGQWRMRGHVIAVQNTDIHEVASCFPLPFEEIPNHMQAIFISIATDKQDIDKLLRQATAFKIEPWNLVCWIRYLIYVYKDLLLGTKIDEALITRYQNLQPGQLPDEFVNATLVAPNEDQARTLAIGYMGGQTEREIQVVTKRDRATRSRGPPSPISDLPFSDDVDEEEEEEEEEEDSEDSDDKDFIASEDEEDK
jgi:hypothetical protein